MTAHRSAIHHEAHRSRRWRTALLAAAAVAALLLASCTPPQPKSGFLDTSYSSDGIANPNAGNGDIRASALQPDGKIVVAGAGYFNDGSPSLQAAYITRHDTAGNPDAGFGTGSFAKVNVASGAEVVRAVTIDSRGRIVVTGTVPAPDYPDETDIFVLRLTSSGQPDTSFSGDGIMLIDRTNHDRVGSVIQNGSRLLLAASFDTGGNWANEWSVVAISDTGTIDTSFNGDGIATVPTSKVGTFDGLRSLALQTDGKIVLGGTSGNDFATARLLADGTLDPTWDGDGVARTLVDDGGQGHTVLVQPDGKVVLAGFARIGGPRSDEDMAAVRWTSTGALDPGFDGDGRAVLDFGRQTNDRAYSAALAPDAKLVLAGFANTASGMDLAVARLDWDGSPDTSFSDDGMTTTNVATTANEQFEAVTVGAGGQVVGAGWSNGQWTLAAYKGGSNVNLTVGDVSLTEPDTGTADAVFTVRLSAAWPTPVTVRYGTANSTAVAPGDYAARSGTLTFAPGETTKTVHVPVQGDTVVEPNEQFRLYLALPTNAGITDGTAFATIVNDD